MANFILATPYVGVKRETPALALADLETHMEAVDTAKIRLVNEIISIGEGRYWQAIALHEA